MCDHKNREKAMVVVARNADGRPTMWCDPCIAPFVIALNEAGFKTTWSCCGHGRRPPVVGIVLADGSDRDLMLLTKEEHRELDHLWPDINEPMNEEKRKKLEVAGWKVGSAEEFLNEQSGDDQMAKCTNPDHQLGPTQEDLDRVEADKKKAMEDDRPKQWFELTVRNEPLLEGNLRIYAVSKEEAEELFAECLQRIAVASPLMPQKG